jgi:hypothetical protein
MKIKYLLWGIAGILLALLSVMLLPIDDELDAEAAPWVDGANDTEDVAGNGYYYLMGIMAAPEEDPEVVGKALIDDYLQAEQKFLNDELEEFTQQEYPEAKKIPLPEGDYYCRSQEAGCFARLSGNAAALRAELNTHAVLLDRYQRYMRFATLKPLLQPSLYERFPPYVYVLRGQRLNRFRIMLEHLSGKHENALSLLQEDITQVRRQLAEAPSLIVKMMALNMLADDLDLLVQLPLPPSDRVRLLSPLTHQERSLRLPMIREFGNIANFHRQLEHHPDSLGFGILEQPVLAMTIRRNMSLNSLFPYYRAIARLSELDATEFQSSVAAGLPAVSGFNLRNAGGSMLASIAAPALHEYAGRMHDLDCKIALVNGVLTASVAETPNPYNPDERPYLDAATQAFCFKGPLEDDQQHRCIPKKA